jgi:hypothetical protein
MRLHVAVVPGEAERVEGGGRPPSALVRLLRRAASHQENPWMIPAVLGFGYALTLFEYNQYFGYFGVAMLDGSVDLVVVAVHQLLQLAASLGSLLVVSAVVPRRIERVVVSVVAALLAIVYLVGPSMIARDLDDGRLSSPAVLLGNITGIQPVCVALDDELGAGDPRYWLINQSELSSVLYDFDRTRVLRVDSGRTLTSTEGIAPNPGPRFHAVRCG